MGVMILLPAMPKAAGAFRRAIEAARERSDVARAVCVASSSPESIVSGGKAAMGKLAGALAAEEARRAQEALAALCSLAERCGLSLSTSVETGNLVQCAGAIIRKCRADQVVLIRPRSELLADEVDRTADALEDTFDGELVIIR